MSSSLGRRVVALCCVVGLLAVPVAGAGFGGFAQEQVDPDTVVLQVDLQEDGDAQWAVIYRTRLDDDNTTAAFESLQADIQNDSTPYTDQFGTRMNRTVASAENATGREMALRNLTVTAEIESLPQEYGVVTYRFEWTNFAVAEDGQLRAGDALAGLFLDSESTLRMRWPDTYERTSVAPSPTRSDATSVAWDGRLDFGSGEPSLVVSETGSGTATDPGGETTTGGGTPDGDGNAGLLLIATLLAGAAVVAVLWANRKYGFVGGAAPADDEDDGDGGDGGAVAAAGAAGGGGDESDDGDDAPPMDLLSNEEQVLRLLDENGGRMKQQQVAEELDWTAAKTSQVIGGLRDEDDVETFRIGRENVVTLPDVDIAGDVGPDDEADGDGE